MTQRGRQETLCNRIAFCGSTLNFSSIYGAAISPGFSHWRGARLCLATAHSCKHTGADLLESGRWMQGTGGPFNMLAAFIAHADLLNKQGQYRPVPLHNQLRLIHKQASKSVNYQNPPVRMNFSACLSKTGQDAVSSFESPAMDTQRVHYASLLLSQRIFALD